MAKNRNRDRKQQQRQGRGMADRPGEQAQNSQTDAQSQAMQSEGGPATAPSSTARKDRQKSFGHN
ncbi:hypothetical protein ACFV2X_55620 [Streptomyces sp. NPDC059679]|uniref:hypothetical protein n=1 Tax=Streptomyces sp. NPDC059679 TaxID=3346903 RepID=UPI00369BA151